MKVFLNLSSLKMRDRVKPIAAILEHTELFLAVKKYVKKYCDDSELTRQHAKKVCNIVKKYVYRFDVAKHREDGKKTPDSLRMVCALALIDKGLEDRNRFEENRSKIFELQYLIDIKIDQLLLQQKQIKSQQTQIEQLKRQLALQRSTSEQPGTESENREN